MNTSGIEHLLHLLDVLMWWASGAVALGVLFELLVLLRLVSRYPEWKRRFEVVGTALVLLGVSGEMLIQVYNTRKTEEYRQLLRGRTLTAGAKTRMAPQLVRFRGQAIDIFLSGTDLETKRTMEAVVRVLVDARWDVGAYKAIGEIEPLGMHVAVRKGSDSTAYKAAAALDSALRRADLAVTDRTEYEQGFMPPMSQTCWGMGLFDHGPQGKGDVRLVIADNPR